MSIQYVRVEIQTRQGVMLLDLSPEDVAALIDLADSLYSLVPSKDDQCGAGSKVDDFDPMNWQTASAARNVVQGKGYQIPGYKRPPASDSAA